MSTPDFFRTYPEPPGETSASNAIARMIDGLGFRLYWALRGLEEKDCLFRPSDDAYSIHEILYHILGLLNWVYKQVFGSELVRPEQSLEQGELSLRTLETLRDFFISVDDRELEQYQLDDRPFWSFINMPLSDALHHVGQVSILRRVAGNPIPKE